MKAYTKGALATVAALTLTLSACGGGNKAGNDASGKEKASNKAATVSWNPQPRDNIKDGGTLTLAITEIPKNLNAWSARANAYTGILWNAYNPGTLTSTVEGEAVVDKNYFIETPKAETKDGKTVITYKVNPKAVFNDGTPIDITAFEAAWKACGEVTPKDYQCNSTDGYNKIESITQGADAKEVIVTLKTAYPWYTELFGRLLHPQALAKDVFAHGYENNPHPEWGAGPFKVEKIDAKEGIATFVRNEKWWGETPKLEKLTYLVRSSNAEMQAFMNGELDAAFVPNKDGLAKLKDVKGIEIRRGSRIGFGLITINAESSMVSDIKIREAILRAVDIKTYQNIVFQGLDYTEEPPGSLIRFAFQKNYRNNFAEVVQYDVEKSNKLLEEAGWVKSGDYRTKDGKTLEITMPYFGDNAVTKARSVALQEMLKKVGIKLNLENPPASDFTKVMDEKKWDMIISGISSGGANSVQNTCQSYCTNEVSGSDLNRSGTQTKELDAKIKEMEKLGTQEEWITRANELETEYFKGFGTMPLVNGVDIYAVKNGLANFGPSAFGGPAIQDLGWQK